MNKKRSSSQNTKKCLVAMCATRDKEKFKVCVLIQMTKSSIASVHVALHLLDWEFAYDQWKVIDWKWLARLFRWLQMHWCQQAKIQVNERMKIDQTQLSGNRNLQRMELEEFSTCQKCQTTTSFTVTAAHQPRSRSVNETNTLTPQST